MRTISIGSVVKVNHPITVLNPEEYFEVVDMEYDIYDRKCSIRGENTCWFGVSMVLDVKNPENGE